MIWKLQYVFKISLNEKKRDERGFTLVELLMVMVIIGVLAGLGFTGFNSLQKRSSRTQADVYWRDLNTAVRMHNIEGYGFPSDIQALIDGSYLDDVKPWGGNEADKGTELSQFPEDGGKVLNPGIVFALIDPDVCVWVNGVSSGLNTDGCPLGAND